MTTLEEVDPQTQALLSRYGFDAEGFEALRARLREGRAELAHNRVTAALMPPLPSDIAVLPAVGSAARRALYERGLHELASKRVAALILAGGMATRFGGVVKAAVEVLDGRSFLELKLRDVEQLARSLGGDIPVLVMTSFATDQEIQRSLRARAHAVLPIETFAQTIALRLTAAGELFRDAAGKPSPYAPGHGDMVTALRRSGLVSRLREAGVRYLFMSNVDNLAATLDPAVVGAHVESGVELTFEVAPLAAEDRGGVPARVAGRLQVIEAARYPEGFDQRTIPWFSINNFVLALDRLDRDFALDWYRVDKQVEGRSAVQFERFVNQLSAFLSSQALAVPREGPESRFLPVKDPQELQARLPMIATVLHTRTLR